MMQWQSVFIHNYASITIVRLHGLEWCNDAMMWWPENTHKKSVKIWSPAAIFRKWRSQQPYWEGWLITILTLTDYPPTFPWHPTALEIHLPSSGPVKWGVREMSVSRTSFVSCSLSHWLKNPIFFVLLQNSQNWWGFQTTSSFLSYAVPGHSASHGK